MKKRVLYMKIKSLIKLFILNYYITFIKSYILVKNWWR